MNSTASAPDRAFYSDALHLLALWSLAVAQPIFDLLGRTPQFFATRQLEPAVIWLVAILTWLGVPVVLALAAAAAGRLFGRGFQAFIVLSSLTILSGLFALQLVKRLGLPAIAAGLLALGVAALFAGLYSRLDALRQFLTLLALLSVAVPIVFLAKLPRQLLLGGADGDGDGSVAVGNPVPVVLVILDELPVISLLDVGQRVDRLLFPNFTRLEETSTWFRHATAVASGTEYAVPAILTGRYPDFERARLATREDHPRNLFSLLEGVYETRVFERRTALCPSCKPASTAEPPSGSLISDLGLIYLHVALPKSWTRTLPSITADWQSFGRLEDKARDFREFIRAIELGERPTLYAAHVLLPHSPWIYAPTGSRYDPGRAYLDGLDAASGRWIDDDWATIQAQQRHLLQLQATDRLLGELLDRLEETGLFDPALLIVVADHGISFQRGAPPRAVSAENYFDVMPVPLFVKLPGQREGRVDGRPVEVVDVLPTIVDVLDAKVDWTFDGRSLLAAEPSRDRRLIYNGPGDYQFVQDPAMARQIDSLRRKLVLFHSAPNLDTFYRIGPFREELWGRPLAELMVTGGELSAEIDQQEDLHAVDPTREVLPTRLTGRLLDPPAGERLALALGVNGTIQALSLTRLEPAWGGHFSFMIPEGALRPGPNTVDLFALAPSQEGPVLERVTLQSSRAYALDGGAIRGPDGTRHPLVDGRFSGSATGVWVGDHQVEVVGWAWDEEKGLPADWIAAFNGERFVHASGPNLEALGMLDRYTLPNLDRGGFVWFLRSDELEDGKFKEKDELVGDVRIFAGVQGGAAGEILFKARKDQMQIVGSGHPAKVSVSFEE